MNLPLIPRAVHVLGLTREGAPMVPVLALGRTLFAVRCPRCRRVHWYPRRADVFGYVLSRCEPKVRVYVRPPSAAQIARVPR